MSVKTGGFSQYPMEKRKVNLNQGKFIHNVECQFFVLKFFCFAQMIDPCVYYIHYMFSTSNMAICVPFFGVDVIVPRRVIKPSRLDFGVSSCRVFDDILRRPAGTRFRPETVHDQLSKRFSGGIIILRNIFLVDHLLLFYH